MSRSADGKRASRVSSRLWTSVSPPELKTGRETSPTQNALNGAPLACSRVIAETATEPEHDACRDSEQLPAPSLSFLLFSKRSKRDKARSSPSNHRPLHKEREGTMPLRARHDGNTYNMRRSVWRPLRARTKKSPETNVTRRAIRAQTLRNGRHQTGKR